ncbi:hypothetical protein VPNG_03526 [Cytospora leucostoma]|uniref:ML-like domain-containing protein n=1 Tax=Cytospora leucostoma TaxID=1230097 RepID=A0A423XCI1_9PEZI|nr:hypothetical protein VPNG_03526 [Cytospora leucostoma]
MRCSSLGHGFSYLSLALVQAAAARDALYTYGTSVTGVTRQLAVDRTPALYTGDFGDCLGGQSRFNITKFDAAYYTDNSTVLFHLDGASNLDHQHLMMRFSMSAYGENRFQMNFKPCSVNIYSMCPLQASVPVTAWAVFAVGPAQVGDIPQLAFTIPDFEGFVRMQMFSNTTGEELGCFQASLENGVTMGHPEVMSPVLAMIALVAVFASFATAAYGVSVPHMRTHYAHSISAMVVFETFQSMFFSGALSVNFPRVLVAWWSNFAWSAGQIYSHSMVRSVDSFAGVIGNAGQVGGARAVVANNHDRNVDHAHQLRRSQPYNASNPYDYTWSGNPVTPGMQLPGTSSGFSGTLSALKIPAADAFTIGLVWLVVLLGLLVLGISSFKFSLEALVKMKRIKYDRMAYFRSHWRSYTAFAVLRTLYTAFAMIVTLALYQFSFGGSTGVRAIAAIVFLLFLLGIGGLNIHTCCVRLCHGQLSVRQDRIAFVHGKALRVVPYVKIVRSSILQEAETPGRTISTFPFIRLQIQEEDRHQFPVHEDQTYVKRFGWLFARYRQTRWWFFGFYSAYQLIRAAFVGGASAAPPAQVYGLLVFEILSFIIVTKLNPFEGQRNTALAVWMLGITKIATTGLSVAFLPGMKLNRIVATGIGFIIVTVQGLLVVGLIILVVLGAMSSYMSLTRNKERFSPEELETTRVRYFEHIQARALDVQMSKKEKELRKILKEVERNAPPPEPSFLVRSVKRMPKIQDEDEGEKTLHASLTEGARLDPNLVSRLPQHDRTNSTSSRLSMHSLPRAAMPSRLSWSSRNPADPDTVSLQRPESSLARSLSGTSSYGLPPTNSMTAVTAYIAEEEPADLGLGGSLPEIGAKASLPIAAQFGR